MPSGAAKDPKMTTKTLKNDPFQYLLSFLFWTVFYHFGLVLFILEAFLLFWATTGHIWLGLGAESAIITYFFAVLYLLHLTEATSLITLMIR